MNLAFPSTKDDRRGRSTFRIWRRIQVWTYSGYRDLHLLEEMEALRNDHLYFPPEDQRRHMGCVRHTRKPFVASHNSAKRRGYIKGTLTDDRYYRPGRNAAASCRHQLLHCLSTGLRTGGKEAVKPHYPPTCHWRHIWKHNIRKLAASAVIGLETGSGF